MKRQHQAPVSGRWKPTLSCCAFSSSYWVLYLRPIFLTCVIVLTFSWMSATFISSSFWRASFSVLVFVRSSRRVWTRFWLVVRDAFDLNVNLKSISTTAATKSGINNWIKEEISIGTFCDLTDEKQHLLKFPLLHQWYSKWRLGLPWEGLLWLHFRGGIYSHEITSGGTHIVCHLQEGIVGRNTQEPLFYTIVKGPGVLMLKLGHPSLVKFVHAYFH